MKKADTSRASVRRSALMRLLLNTFLAVAFVLTTFVVLPFAVIAFGFWAAEGSWDFEGRGFRYWMLVQGSRLERIGTVEPTPNAVKYSIRFGEGNFPGWNIATYESTALPEQVAAVYAERCQRLKLKVIENKTEPNPKTGALRAELTCEIEVYLNVEILAEREIGADVSKVFLKVWGSD
jgi:hypothetical protein